MGSAPDLAKYEAKRDFERTAEPRDSDGVVPSDKLRFVVQRHDARRLHYDLRLELDGVFRSWAVTKGPSLNPTDKRLAVEVEDHPLSYGDFEGTIPQGQYGGGTVQLFDRGTWASEGDGDPREALASGELKFVLSGKRLKGSFVLVRLKHDKYGSGKRTNWLLIKHRDAKANDAEDGGGVMAIETSVASGRTLATIAAGKGKAPKPFMLAARRAPSADAVWDSSKGLAAQAREAEQPTKIKTNRKSATKAEQSTEPKADRKPAVKARTNAVTQIPSFVPPQLCRSVAKPPGGAGWLHEIKFDGYRAQVRVENGAARLRTRSGLDWSDKFPAIVRAASGLADCLIDGEIVALDGEGKPDFAAVQAAIAAGKTGDLMFFAFDLLFSTEGDLRKQPLRERKSRLGDVLAGRASNDPLRFVEHFETGGADMFRSAVELGLEGVVSKRLDAAYRSGRSETWTKAKCRVTHEVVLGGWTSNGKAFRSLLGGVFRDGKLIYVGRIGTGFGAGVVAKLMPQLQAHARASSPFDRKGAPPRDRDTHWLDPVLVGRIELAGWSSDGLLRQASFKGLHADMPAADVAVEQPAAPATPVAKVKPAATAAKSGRVTVMGVSLSHPDKALWPDDGDGQPVTKRDLALYFEAVGAWMLPHVADRPCSIIRAPDGIDGQTFFQRHAMAGGSKLLGTVVIAGDRQPYVSLGSVEALAAVAQSGGLELHPSSCAPGKPLVPGRLVFDFDPAPDVPFADVIAAAKAMKQILEEVGLVGFPKTTGGKGLHLVTPLTPDPAVSWEEAKAFAHDICRLMEQAEPGKFLTKASKAARKGRIYLDWLRNDRLSTAVAPLSPRGRPHAPVSMPLTWAQVKTGLDPARYTIRTVPKLLPRSKAWHDYEAQARSLGEAIRRLKAL